MTSSQYPGKRLNDKPELLRRVVPLAKSKIGVSDAPGSEAFKPQIQASAFRPGGRGSHDNGGLSTKRAAEEPSDAYWAYLRSAKPPGGRLALGTWGFTVGEADSLQLPAYDDGGLDEAHPENHATVWFPMPPEESNKQLKLRFDRLAEELRKFAERHGCLFKPANPEADARSLRTTSV
ncbi:hypothetical protein A5725_24600 [Mycobacterium kubicae]|uniref:hypothetical protein n=1 Tax=Mycobacterium kubicae TaxID=120959 RepID=UPI0007FEBF2E|nr:hypothetical protein [Mycobacterium kubicae]OBF17202.1 hypothetical protein A5725_24600 [Mycobacterium kubicae]